RYTNDPEDKSVDDVLKSTGQNEADSNLSETTKLIINGSKALFVSKGTSLLAIATQNNINLNRLLEINDLQKDGLLDKDQYIFLEKKQKEGDRDYYIAQQNEILYDIAQKNGIILQSLYDYNDITSADNIYPGTKILLRPSLVKGVANTDNKKTYVSSPPAVESKIHEVQPKESLYAISKKYGVSVNQLKEWNNLRDNNLKPGQQLIISK
ncbi:MAG: LysM peptidoglycan-binding domain-containing protein, partial [Bacteroidia bacterium]